ncbi:unnamed protein product, partial [Vitis vinifera]|uniref:Transmembrane protein n=1 Tax=Vitis vinifera TaxID=29760 RepID=D7UBR2_VITVI
MVFHKVSPTICILLSVLLLFLSQETLSRELIQVAPYEDKTVHLDGGISPSCSPHAHHGHVTCRHPAHIVGSPPT